MTDKKHGFLDTMKGTLAAFLGVQSSKDYEHDFTGGKASHFIIAGIIGTIVFILLVWGVVKLVLSLAGV